jgi:hypothetical protein
MKRFGWILMLLLAASPAWAAGKITVEQLKDLLASLKQAQKTDAEVAAELGNVELTEELPHSTMNSLAPYLPGELSKEQMFVLEVRSAVLAPPAADLPAAPPPDAATQKAILDKALDYTAKIYGQLPSLTATKTARRFQDNVEPIQGSKAAHSSAVVATPTAPIRYMTGAETQATFQNGAESNPLAKDKTHWGANGMIALLGQGPDLATILQEANSAEKISWLRWEMVNSKQLAVYSFAVDKKKTHYAVNYCCFPDSDQAGPLTMRGTGQQAGSGPGNYQSNTNWKNYKATVPYHGEIFVDPDTGIVVRLITEAEFKSSELVRQEDRRIDYGPETVGGKTLVLPVKEFINTLALPDGDTPQGRLNLRHTLFTADYKNYQPAGN